MMLNEIIPTLQKHYQKALLSGYFKRINSRMTTLRLIANQARSQVKRFAGSKTFVRRERFLFLFDVPVINFLEQNLGAEKVLGGISPECPRVDGPVATTTLNLC